MHEKKSQHKKGIILSELALRNIHKFSITDSLGLEKISQQTMTFNFTRKHIDSSR